ncbi:MAG: YDG domain-containing protein [Clostridiaceae bacterium]|nr:YDG domain-containing protein [Clostridiaceae bacterium]
MRKIVSWFLTAAMFLSLAVTTAPIAQAVEVTQRYIYDAETLSDGTIGVLFIYGGTSSSGIVTGGTLYYGIYDPDTQSWSQQPVTPGGSSTVAAKDAAMALDCSGNPHVAYVFTGGDLYDDIGYAYLSEGSWTEALSFSSNNDGDRTDGTLSSPRIAVDFSGTAHIAYIDSQGNNDLSSYSRSPDLMYRTIDGGSIGATETIVHGFCENAGGSTYYQNSIVSVPAITSIGNTVYIGCASKGRYGGAYDWSAAYTIFPRPSGSNASFDLYYGSSSACERGFKQFAMAADGAGTYTLYYVSGTTTGGIPAGLHIANGTSVPMSFSSPGTSITTGDITTSGEKVYAAGINTSTLVLFQNAALTTKTLSTALSSTHTRMATVVAGSNQYIFYTGNDTAKSLFIVRVPTEGGDLDEYQVPNKTPVTITGVTVAEKVYDGEPAAPGGTLIVTGADLTEADLDYTYTSTDGGGYSSTSPPTQAGAYKLVISVPESNANYSGASSDILFDITKKPIVVTGTAAIDRAYAPGDLAIILNTDNSTLSGVILADDSLVTLDKSGAIGTVATAAAGEGKTVTVTGFILLGSKADNYALSQPTGVTVDITPAELAAPTVSLIADSGNGGLSATVSDTANTLGVASYTLEVYREGALVKTLTGLSKNTALNIPLETGVIEPETSYTTKAKTVADTSGNYTDSALGTQSAAAVAQYAPLGFADSAAYDIPESQVDKPIMVIDVSGGVTGGKAPYSFTADGLPAWVQINSFGIISGTPASVAAAGGTATVTVTDAQSNQQSITIAYGTVGKGDALAFSGVVPPTEKTYGNAPFALELTYDGQGANVSYSIISGPGTMEGSTLTITGAGSIVVRATGTSDNYLTKTADYVVAVNKKAVIITPTASSNKKVYGSADPMLTYTHTELVGGDSLSDPILTRAAGENAGDYAISVATSASANNPNYDLTLASGSYNFTITPKSLTVGGAAINSKEYDGTTAIELSDVTSVTLNGDLDSLVLGTDFEVTAAAYTSDAFSGTNKATSITVALKGAIKANNYEFTDGAGTYTGAATDITSAVQTLTAAAQTLTVTHTLDLSSVASSNAPGAVLVYTIEGGTSEYATLSGSILTGTAPGTLTVNINSAAVDVGGSVDFEYMAALQKQIIVTVSAKTNADNTITFEDDGITYGETYSPNATTTLTGGTWSYQYTGTATSGASYSGITPPTLAGSYTVTATYENDTHIGTKAAGMTIARKALTITDIAAVDKTYDGTNVVSILGGTLSGIITGDAVTPIVPATGTTADANAGDNKAVTLGPITLDGADKDNYTLTQPAGITVDILPKAITFMVETVTGQEYTGAQITPAPTVKDVTTTLAEGIDYTLGYGANLNAGTGEGSITVTGIRNYLGSSADVTFDITKSTYGGAAVLGTKQVISNTAVEDVIYDLSAIAFPAGFLNKSFFSATIENDPQGLLSGASVSGSILTFNVAAKAAGTSGELHVVVCSDNYNSYTVVITITTVDKAPVIVTGVTVMSKIYNGIPAVADGIPTNGDGYSGFYEYWYEGTGATAYGSATAPKNAGTYRLIVRIPADDPTYTGAQMVDFTISKAVLIVKPHNVTIYIGDSLPTPTVSYEGLQGSDEGAAIAQLSSGNLDMEIKDADGVTALASSAARGSYTIVFIGSPVFSEADNYTITTVNGILTINNRPSGGDGSSDSPSYNADVSNGGRLPVNVNSEVNSASVNLETITSNLANGDNLFVTLPSIPGVTTYTAIFPVSSLSGSKAGSMTINTEKGSITVPGNMLFGMGLTGNAEINLGVGDRLDLPDDVKNVIGDHPIISLTLTIGGHPAAWSKPDVPVAVSIPYAPTAEELEDPESIVVWYIDDSGNIINIPNGHYDAAAGTVAFTITHFSNYAVAYNKVSFNDVSSTAWYHDAVSFIAARGITTGTCSGIYSPDAKLTRGEFIVLLMRAYGISPDTSFTDNFTDAGNTYYTGYLAAAKRLGITLGVGNNMYAPGREITRQEMFTLLYNALKIIGQLPQGNSGKTVLDFSDASQISDWAREAMATFVVTGTVVGSNGKLTPTGTATRAEIAQVLLNLLER